jgi:hypothetical protein
VISVQWLLLAGHGLALSWRAPLWECTALATPEFQAIATRLNEFELVSIGIQRGIIDFELYTQQEAIRVVSVKYCKEGASPSWRRAVSMRP